MNVEIQIDASYIDPKVIIITAEVTEKVNGIVKKLSEDIPQLLSGIREGAVKILEKADIIRIYAEAGKTVAVTEDGEYTVRSAYRRFFRAYFKLGNNQSEKS